MATCGSVWACPRCSAKIAAGRQGDIEAALSSWHEYVGDHSELFDPYQAPRPLLGPARRTGERRVALMTFTVRHNRGQRLRSLWDAVAASWHAASSGGGWKDDQEVHGTPLPRKILTGKNAGQWLVTPRIPTIRVVEVTNGDAGWHVHVHALVLLGRDATDASVAELGQRMFGRWAAAAQANGLDAPTDRHGWDARLLVGDPSAALGEYFTKAVYSASMETARGDLKDARGGNRTPFGVLRGLVQAESGEVGTELDPDELKEARMIWGEWERGSKGRRQVAWSPGLRRLLLAPELADELTDEELAEQVAGGDAVAEIPKPVFRQIAKYRADWQVLSAFQRSNREGWEFVAFFFGLAQAAEADRARQLRAAAP